MYGKKNSTIPLAQSKTLMFPVVLDETKAFCTLGEILKDVIP